MRKIPTIKQVLEAIEAIKKLGKEIPTELKKLLRFLQGKKTFAAPKAAQKTDALILLMKRRNELEAQLNVAKSKALSSEVIVVVLRKNPAKKGTKELQDAEQNFANAKAEINNAQIELIRAISALENFSFGAAITPNKPANRVVPIARPTPKPKR
jgi:hypothetical protein